MRNAKLPISWEMLAVAAALLYPLVPAVDDFLFRLTHWRFGFVMPTIFILAILALALNVVVGYAGLLHLGIAGFFGIGAYVTGILTVPAYPFGCSFWLAVLASTLVATAFGIVLSAPLLRLRGDYFALVTLGFGLAVMYSIRNLEEITAGTKSLNPVPPPELLPPFGQLFEAVGWGTDWASEYRLFYYLTLAFLLGTILLLRNLERSSLGRAWVALREDELAATCMGLNAARLKLAAFALSAALAGMAGSLYAIKLGSTADPLAYDFNRSVTMLCCLILGGLGNRNGVLLGVALILGYDNLLAPILDDVQRALGEQSGWKKIVLYPFTLLMSTKGKLMMFGLVLILMMRYRPEGLLPSSRVREEMHEGDPAPPTLPRKE